MSDNACCACRLACHGVYFKVFARVDFALQFPTQRGTFGDFTHCDFKRRVEVHFPGHVDNHVPPTVDTNAYFRLHPGDGNADSLVAEFVPRYMVGSPRAAARHGAAIEVPHGLGTLVARSNIIDYGRLPHGHHCRCTDARCSFHLYRDRCREVGRFAPQVNGLHLHLIFTCGQSVDGNVKLRCAREVVRAIPVVIIIGHILAARVRPGGVVATVERRNDVTVVTGCTFTLYRQVVAQLLCRRFGIGGGTPLYVKPCFGLPCGNCRRRGRTGVGDSGLVVGNVFVGTVTYIYIGNWRLARLDIS